MKIGFTGTQIGMTRKQKNSFFQLIAKITAREWINEVIVFNHGDCVGADAQAHHLTVEVWKFNNFRSSDAKVVIHPPKNSYKRAFCKAKEIREPKEYIERNHIIVDESDILIATPKEFDEQLRSGTWATVRYARKKNKRVYIINPDGTIV